MSMNGSPQDSSTVPPTTPTNGHARRAPAPASDGAAADGLTTSTPVLGGGGSLHFAMGQVAVDAGAGGGGGGALVVTRKPRRAKRVNGSGKRRADDAKVGRRSPFGDDRLPVLFGASAAAPGQPGLDDPSTDPARQADGNELQRLHRIMRGRYLLAGLLAAALGTGLGLGGYKLGVKTFVSTGQVRVIPDEKFLRDSGGPVNLEALAESQAAMVKSTRVLDLAMREDRWAKLKRDAGPEGTSLFAAAVDAKAVGENILVTFADQDPDAATAGAGAVVTAFDKMFKERQSTRFDKKIEALDARCATLKNDIATSTQRLQTIAGTATQSGTTDLQSVLSPKLYELSRKEERVHEIEAQLPNASRVDAGPSTAPAARDWTDDELAQFDQQLRGLKDEVLATDGKLQDAKATGMADEHPDVKRLTGRLASLRERYKARLATVRADVLAQGLPAPRAVPMTADRSGAPRLSQSPDELKAELGALKEQTAKLQEDVRRLNVAMSQMSAIRTEVAGKQADYDRAEHEADLTRFERSTALRLEVVSDGDRPFKPAKDTRVALAGAGGVGGGLLGFGLIFLLGLTDRRLRNLDDATKGVLDAPVLGVLPTLPDDLSDPTEAAVAAHSVHEIRARLQIRCGRNGHDVFAITSPMAGTGKTSLTLALGVSFATNGLRTLVIDCDLVGGGLTSRINTVVKRKIGQVLRRDGVITPEQLAEALALANGSRRRLGEILLDLGYLSPNDLERAVLSQAEGQVGLLDALAGEPLEDCVARTGIPGLYVLPLGSASPGDVGKLSPALLRRLLDRCRQHFDTVLVDSGPIPGSLEASLVASQVDGVILTLSRGEQRPAAERAAQHLRTVGAQVAGVVFNRASEKDLAGSSRSIQVSRARSIPAQEPLTPRGDGTAPGAASRLGPMASAVAYSQPTAGGSSPSDGGGR